MDGTSRTVLSGGPPGARSPPPLPASGSSHPSRPRASSWPQEHRKSDGPMRRTMSLKLLVPARLGRPTDSPAVRENLTFAHPSHPKDHADGILSIRLSKTVRLMSRRSTMRRVRTGKAQGRESGFLVTWDVNSADRTSVNRLRRFVDGDSTRCDGKQYRYSGFVEKDGVRYLGQSVLFVRPYALSEIVGFLASNSIDHEVTAATIG